MKEKIEYIKETALLYIEDVKNYFGSKSIKKKNLFIYIWIFIFFIFWILLNFLNFKYSQTNNNIKQNIQDLTQQNIFLQKNNNKLVLIKTINLNKNLNWNLQLLNFLYMVNNYIKNYDNWMWKIQIKSVQKIQWKKEAIITFTNVVRYNFFDAILSQMKLYKLNINVLKMAISINSNNKKYLSFIVKIKFSYNNVFQNNFNTK